MAEFRAMYSRVRCGLNGDAGYSLDERHDDADSLRCYEIDRFLHMIPRLVSWLVG